MYLDWFRLRHTLGMYCHTSGVKRAEYLRKHNVFEHVGVNCMVMFRKIPLYAKQISLGDNVWIASDVSLITHDVIHRMLNNCRDLGLKENIGKIVIGDNVFIGANTSILPGVHIGYRRGQRREQGYRRRRICRSSGQVHLFV